MAASVVNCGCCGLMVSNCFVCVAIGASRADWDRRMRWGRLEVGLLELCLGGAGVPSLGLKFCIVDLLCFCISAMVLCGGEQLGPLPVLVAALCTAACVVSVVLGACRS